MKKKRSGIRAPRSSTEKGATKGFYPGVSGKQNLRNAPGGSTNHVPYRNPRGK